MEDSGDKLGIKVTFLDQTGAKSVQAVIAEKVRVKKIIPNIITKMKLPVTSPDGTPMSYSLDHKEGGKRLLEDQTLAEAGVKDGDHLIVYPEIVAGAKPRRVVDLPSYEWSLSLQCFELASRTSEPQINGGPGGHWPLGRGSGAKPLSGIGSSPDASAPLDRVD
ncbi:MAG: EsaB/YukD family protein [Candidatus Wallbacteria bacterium]|nr:EsaB/YukD family protein [Candidatus Wallbacteria bacterium]